MKPSIPLKFSPRARRMLWLACVFAAVATPLAGQNSRTARLPARELFENVAVSALVQWYRPGGDLGEYWNDAPVAGLRAWKVMDQHFGIVVQGAVSYMKPAETSRRDRIPDLGLLTLHTGLRGQQLLFDPIEGFAEIGLETQTFWYLGDEAAGNLYARIESEIGMGLLGGLEVRLPGLPLLEILAGRHVVFTGPEYLVITSIGLSVRLFEL